MINRLASLTLLTFKEGVRDRALLGIGLFCLIIMGSSLVVVSLFMRELHKVAVDMNLSVITFAGLMMTFFLSINLMAKDIDKHTIHCVLSKPFSRTEYVFGKFFGMMLLIFSAFTILTLCSTLTIYLIKIQFGDWFAGFRWIGVYKAILSEFLMMGVLNAGVILFSTMTSSSFITLLFSLATYIAGQTIEEVVLYLKTQPDIIMTETNKTVILISQYILPNLSAFDLKVHAAHALQVSGLYMLSITGYAFVYCSVLLIAASMIFGKRELV